MQKRASIIGPLILITIGVLFLLANFGYISGSFWLSLLQFWPLILILLGLEILIGRTWQGQILVLLAGLLAVGGVVWLLMNPAVAPLGMGMQTETVGESSTGVQSAHLELKTGVGDLDMRPLVGSDGNWIEGTVSHPASLRLAQEYQNTGGVAQLKLDTEGNVIFLGNSSERWNIHVAPGMPLTLKIDAGVGSSKLDLNALDVTDIDMNTGVGGTEVILPSNAGTVNARIKGGIGGLTILIPVGVPARIRSNSGIGGASINQARFPSTGQDLFESPDYATATNRIDLTVDAGIGGITIP